MHVSIVVAKLTDWRIQETIDALFPTDPQTGQLSFSTFVDTGMGPQACGRIEALEWNC
jgi:hypothetical protein